jgi:hypothetical protein
MDYLQNSKQWVTIENIDMVIKSCVVQPTLNDIWRKLERKNTASAKLAEFQNKPSGQPTDILRTKCYCEIG